MLFECKRFRIEIHRCTSGSFHVSVRPVEYLGKEEFKRWMKTCRRNFMSLTARWTWTRVFARQGDATGFAKHLARELGELVFLNLNEIQIATPKEEVLSEH